MARLKGNRTIALRSVGLLAVLWFGTVAAFAADPVIGTWELDVAKSTYRPGPPPLSQTRVYEALPKGIKVTVTTIYADGRKNVAEYESDNDGRDYPVTGRSFGDTVSLKKVDDFTAEATIKHADKLIAFVLRDIAPDGKTMTITYSGAMSINGVDERANNIAVYNKR